MPQTNDDIPSTVKRSPAKAQRTWKKTHDSAVEEYGEGERAHRTAFASLKHSFEKTGDHWEAKNHQGPSDPRAKNPDARHNKGESFGGVDVEGSTRAELMNKAKRLDVSGRSHMTKAELGRAINQANQRETAKTRQG